MLCGPVTTIYYKYRRCARFCINANQATLPHLLLACRSFSIVIQSFIPLDLFSRMKHALSFASGLALLSGTTYAGQPNTNVNTGSGSISSAASQTVSPQLSVPVSPVPRDLSHLFSRSAAHDGAVGGKVKVGGKGGKGGVQRKQHPELTGNTPHVKANCIFSPSAE